MATRDKQGEPRHSERESGGPRSPSGRLALLVTGASGMALPRHAIGVLAAHPQVERLHVVVSRGAAQVLAHEMGRDRTSAEDLIDAAAVADKHRSSLEIHRDSELDAAISSGSYPLDGSIILPCSAGTIGALATGSAATLIHRAGAVALKERWPLILGFRETPYTLVHLENLRRLAYAGATVLPPVPAFYIGGESFERFLDHYLMRILDHLGLNPAGRPDLRWRGSD
jgi:4-hydroxy-3-polyprenylbenzoate decarboxylase